MSAINNPQSLAKKAWFYICRSRMFLVLSFFAFIVLFFGVSTPVNAATEFVSIIDTAGTYDAGGTGDFDNLSEWESTVQADLTATTTKVFSYSSASGTIPNLATVVGEISGATATSTFITSTTTTSQILLTNINGTFQSGETVYIQGQATSSNYVIISDNGDSVVAVAQCTATDGAADINTITITGWTTSAANYIKIWTDPTDPYGRHNGVWDENKYRMQVTNPFIMVRNDEDYVRIQGLQIKIVGTATGSGKFGIYNDADGTNSEVHISDNIVVASHNGTGGNVGDGIEVAPDVSTSGQVTKVWNNIVYGTNPAETFIYGLYMGDGIGYLYNNTVYGAGIGYSSGSGNDGSYLKNNLIYCDAVNSNFTDFASTPTAYNNNLSSDATSPNGTSFRNKTVVFADETNYDFHLSLADTSALNAGTSTILWDSNLNFIADIDGTARGAAWDIGADEMPVEFVSTICENTSAGGDCANMDYSTLGGTSGWEDKVESNLTASSTRVFSGSKTGILNENTAVNLCNGTTDLNIDGVVVATTSDQILIDGITGTTTPLSVVSGTIWSAEACASTANYWAITGTGDALGASPIAVAKIDGAWTGAESNLVAVVGWTSDNDNYIKIYTTGLARHKGKWSETTFRLDVESVANYDVAIKSQEDYVLIDGLQVKLTSIHNATVGISAEAVNIDNKIIISNNIVQGIIGGVGNSRGIQVYDANMIASISNNIIYDFASSSAAYGIYSYEANPSYIYSNTIVNCDRGIGIGNGTSIIKNNLIASTTDPFYGSFVSSSTNNATDGTDTPAGGSNTITSAIINFVSTASGAEDFHLTDDSTDLINAGVDLSSDIGLSRITKNDIDSAARNPDDLGWDIGADEIPAKQYRSVGNIATTLGNTGTVTISSTTRTATFSNAQADNVGVGDVIQYGSPYQLAFIISRTSSTVYGVQAWDAKAPTATTSAAFAVYRAHLELDDWEDASTDNVVGDVNSGISDNVDDFVLVNPDLVASNTQMMVAAYASTAGDDAAVTIDGWDTGAQNYIKIYTPVDTTEVGASQRHDGVWDDGRYRLDPGSLTARFDVLEDYIFIEGLQVALSGSDSSSVRYLFRLQATVDTNNEVKIHDNILKGGMTGSQYHYGIAAMSNRNVKIWNNILYNFTADTVGRGVGINLSSVASGYVYNNTISDCGIGLARSTAGSPLLKNNIVQNCTDNGYSGTFDAASDYNISDFDQTDADDVNVIFDGYKTVTFSDEANHDLHLAADDTSARDAGTDLSSDTNLAFTTDIDNHTRGNNGAWDIGADEGSLHVYYSVGQDGTTDRQTGTSTVTISNGTATFSTAQIGNIGVGDVINYGTIGYVYIKSKNTTSNWSVVTASGTTPVATTTAMVNSIKRAFSSLSSAVVTAPTLLSVSDLKTNNHTLNLPCYYDTGADTNAVTVDGYITGQPNFIKVYTPNNTNSEANINQRHEGVWNSERYRLEVTNGACFKTNEDYTWIDGIQANIIANTSGTRYGIWNDADGTSGYSDVRISNNIVKGQYSATANTGEGIFLSPDVSNDNNASRVWNNIVYDINFGSSVNMWGIDVDNGKSIIYNNTIYNCYIGIVTFSGADMDYIKNNIVIGDSINSLFIDYQFISGGTYEGNISSDATSPDTAYRSKTVSFVDTANDDFHLATNDTSALDTGTDLSSDSIFAFSTDIDGDTRPTADSWDIGADEAAVPIYRSVGPSATSSIDNDNSHADTITISSSTATFSAEIANNVGVGDVVLYDSNNDNALTSADTIFFIHGRTDSTHYTVKDQYGATPATTTTANDTWSIYRAYTSLSDAEAGTENTTLSGLSFSYTGGNRDLVTNNEQWNIACYANGTTADTTAVDITSWTTGVQNFIRIYTPVNSSEVGTSQRHQGVWMDNLYKISNTTSDVITSSVPNIVIHGLQVELNTINTWREGISLGLLANNAEVGYNIIKNINTGTSNAGITANGSNNLKIYNNIVYDFDTVGSRGMSFNTVSDKDGTIFVYNNTIYNCTTGYSGGYHDLLAKNNIAQGCTDGFSFTAWTGTDYNISDLASDAPSPSYRTNLATEISFADPANHDFHLASTDTSARNAGADLSADANIAITTDIDGHTRSTTTHSGAFDIGADEAATAVYFSAGQNTTSHETGAGTVAIASGIATFSVAQTATNMGVGDAVVAGGNTYYITGKTSTLIWTVKTATGTTPADIAATDVTSVSHAFASLSLAEAGASGASYLNTADLWTNNFQLNIPCYYDSGPDTTAVTIDGYTTGVPNYIRIYTPYDTTREVNASQRHGGKWDDAKYRLEISTNNHIIYIADNFVRIDGIQCGVTYADKYGIYANYIDGIGGEIYVSNNIMYSINGDSGYAIWPGDADISKAVIFNNLIYGGWSNGINSGSPAINYVYNNTVVGCDTLGISGTVANTYAKNNIVADTANANDYHTVAGAPYSSNNIGNGETPPGSDAILGKPSFVDETNSDFHLAPTDTTAMDAGTSSVSEIADIAYDIDNHLRTQYDIGADEGSQEFVGMVMQTGGTGDEYSTLATWETGMQTDLVASSTRVFTISEKIGTVADNASVTGSSSGATADIVHVSTTTMQVLLENISGTFEIGEQVQVDASNYIVISDLGNPAIAVARIDGAWASADTNAVTIDGWTTGANNYVKVYTTDEARHAGKWDSGKYRLDMNPVASGEALRINNDNVEISGIQISVGGTNAYVYGIEGHNDNINLSNLIIKSTNTGDNNMGIRMDQGLEEFKMYNCIIYDFGSSGIYGSYSPNTKNYIFYNNTIINSGNCFNGGYQSNYYINNIAQNCNDGFAGSDSDSDYNISNDSQADADSVNATFDGYKTVSFVDSANSDFHLSTTDTSAKDAGVDLSASAPFSSSDTNDIDGNPRFDTGWDIGADEAATILYRSVGLHPDDLNTGAETVSVTVANNTATAEFSGDLAANIGVGDAIQYGSPLSLAFITGRVSASEFYVQSATGSSPVATTTAAASVYRAHQHLDDWEDQIVGDVTPVVNDGLDDLFLVNTNLAASNTAMFVPCYASSSADTLNTEVLGWTTATTSYIRIYTPVSENEVGITQRHNGVWDSAKYILDYSADNSYRYTLRIRENYVRVEGLQIKMTNNGFMDERTVQISDGYIDPENEIWILNNIIWGVIDGTSYNFGIYTSDADTILKVYNNVVYGFNSTHSSTSGIRSAGKIMYAYNNTVSGNNIGISLTAGVAYAQNNAVFNNVDDFSGSFTEISYNASDDGDGTNAIILGDAAAWKAAFTDYENYDFSIRDISSVLYDAGTTITIITDDIIGTARPYYDAYDIGAFEFTATKPKYRFSPGGNFKFEGDFEFR